MQTFAMLPCCARCVLRGPACVRNPLRCAFNNLICRCKLLINGRGGSHSFCHSLPLFTLVEQEALVMAGLAGQHLPRRTGSWMQRERQQWHYEICRVVQLSSAAFLFSLFSIASWIFLLCFSCLHHCLLHSACTHASFCQSPYTSSLPMHMQHQHEVARVHQCAAAPAIVEAHRHCLRERRGQQA